VGRVRNESKNGCSGRVNDEDEDDDGEEEEGGREEPRTVSE
jgi:hypothetical protein